ncbi:MarR family winged helix-turn-helix transcriptional regulator [Sphaerotilus microaerophilus]|uniref:Transcriptional regulator n=1 Tax=Sphaerotilus microaerophilus TaxID=2914710 RepID=A0ABM7YLL8_9BURK|nr:MarR family winged helix-turn-helix transcriptional regulator [Sphaerotilus sp. FB-5]BDI05330.1 transcriptional regulator [Sphaerotilus sp. FB-5]
MLKSAPPPFPAPTLAGTALDDLPGHYIRRLQQIAVALFMEETAESGITPVQFATLTAAHEQPGLDQRSLAAMICFDTSTIGGVIDRLEKRGLMLRNAAPHDRRLRLLTVTPAGEALLAEVTPRVQAVQQRILAPLPPDEQAHFLHLLRSVVDAHGETSDQMRGDGSNDG